MIPQSKQLASHPILAINQRGPNESANGSQQCGSTRISKRFRFVLKTPFLCPNLFTLKSETLRIISGHTVLTLTWTRIRSSASLGMAETVRPRKGILAPRRIDHISDSRNIRKHFAGTLNVSQLDFGWNLFIHLGNNCYMSTSQKERLNICVAPSGFFFLMKNMPMMKKIYK